MVAQTRTRPITAAEYLKYEREAETKSEFDDGVIVAMSGVSRQHDRITTALLRHLGNQLENGTCETFSADMRVGVPACNRYFYPDVSVVCGEPTFEDAELDTLLNPILVFEVLSPPTERRDRGEKFSCYQALASPVNYVLVAQDRPRVEVYHRMEDGDWRLHIVSGLDGTIRLPVIGCELAMADVYARVNFENVPEAGI